MASESAWHLAVERGVPNEQDWPALRAAERCDGENPMTGSACINGNHRGNHRGYHRDRSGAEWLDDE